MAKNILDPYDFGAWSFNDQPTGDNIYTTRPAGDLIGGNILQASGSVADDMPAWQQYLAAIGGLNATDVGGDAAGSNGGINAQKDAAGDALYQALFGVNQNQVRAGYNTSSGYEHGQLFKTGDDGSLSPLGNQLVTKDDQAGDLMAIISTVAPFFGGGGLSQIYDVGQSYAASAAAAAAAEGAAGSAGSLAGNYASQGGSSLGGSALDSAGSQFAGDAAGLGSEFSNVADFGGNLGDLSNLGDASSYLSNAGDLTPSLSSNGSWLDGLGQYGQQAWDALNSPLGKVGSTVAGVASAAAQSGGEGVANGFSQIADTASTPNYQSALDQLNSGTDSSGYTTGSNAMTDAVSGNSGDWLSRLVGGNGQTSDYLKALVTAGGAVAGSQGTPGQSNTTQQQIDPRFQQILYGTGYGDPNSALGAANANWQQNKSGQNATSLQGLQMLKDAYTGQGSSIDQIRGIGQGLLSGGVAGNPFTSGQRQAPQGLLSQMSQPTPAPDNPYGLLRTTQPVRGSSY